MEGLHKLEFDGDENEDFRREEFENTFGSDNDASIDHKFNGFPKALNPGFDLQIALSVSIFISYDLTLIVNDGFKKKLFLVWLTIKRPLLQ